MEPADQPHLLQVAGLKSVHKDQLCTAKDSLKQQLDSLQLQLSSQATAMLQQQAALDACHTDQQQLKESSGRLVTDNQHLKARLAAYQADTGFLQNQRSTWRLAELWHWRRRGFLQVRLVLHAWAIVSRPASAQPQEQPREPSSSTDGVARLQQQEVHHAQAGSRYWERRLLGCCFKGGLLA